MIHRITGCAMALALTGCASIVNDSTHPMRLETKTADGQMVAGAECKITNDYGTVTTRSGDTATVRRSAKDLDISCKSASSEEAGGRAISRANGGMMGNILFGGGIGAIIDHNKGTAYTYPTWVQLVFGKTLVFDRSAEKEGQPVLGMEPAGGSTASTATNATVNTTASTANTAAAIK